MSKRKQAAKKPVQIQQQRPWGLIAGSVVLALAMLGILGYAIANKGEGFISGTERADNAVRDSGTKAELQTFSELPRNDHKEGVLEYDQSPPIGGTHNPRWQNCGVYTEQIPNEHAVHSLEHGAVWITYRPGLAADQVAKLNDVVEGEMYGLLSPYPGQKTAVSLQAWGRQIAVESADDPAVEAFFDAYNNGPQTPEKGAACSGGVSITGSTPVGVPAPSDSVTLPPPSPAATASARATATPAS